MNISNSVFRYFRYENTGNNLLDHKTFNFFELMSKKNILEKDNQTLITSLEQVGKTFLTIPVSIIYLSLNLPVVYLVMDRNQKKQVHRRLNRIMTELYKYLKELSYSEDDIERFNPDSILYYDSINKCDLKSLENALSGIKPRLIFVIKEYTQIKRLNKFLKNKNIVLILDEVHKTGAYKKDADIYHDNRIKYDESIVYMKQYAKKIINVSATGQDFIMVESLYSDNILYIPPNEFHTGIKDWLWDIEFSTKKDKKNDIIPKSVLDFLERKTSQKIIKRYDRKNKKVDLHPHIILCKYHRKLEKQKEMLLWFQENEDYGEWTIIVYQGEGITLYYKNISEEPVAIKNEDGETQYSIIKDNSHYFTSNVKNSIGITDCLQFLAERGVTNHSRILIIGFDMVCEGISYTSHYDKPQNWHLTGEIIKFSGNESAALQKQVLSRVNGNHGDDIKPEIAVDFKIKEKVLNSYEMTDKQIQKCIELSKTDNVEVCREYLDTIEYYKNRVPNNHYKIKTIITKTIANPNTRKERKIIKEMNSSIDILHTLYPEKYEKEKDKIIEIQKFSSKQKDKIENYIKIHEEIKLIKSRTIKDIKQVEDTIYYLMDQDELRKYSIQFSIIDEIIKQVIDRKKIGDIILRTEIINWILLSNKFGKTTSQNIKGSIDAGIVHKMNQVKDNNENGLIYWKEKGRYFFRLNI